jgi:hypothetical protein
MVMFEVSQIPVLKTELKTRLKIFLFMILLFEFSIAVASSIKSAALLYSLYALLEVCSMVVIYRFAGVSGIGKDINELNLYALIVHIIGLPIYYWTELPLQIHDYSIWGLFFVSMGRLFYFGKQTEGEYAGFSFSLSEHIKKCFYKKHFTYWSELLFFGSAIPLWFIIYRTNDKSITVTAIGLMLFIYFITDSLVKNKLEEKTAINEISEYQHSNNIFSTISHIYTKISSQISEKEKAELIYSAMRIIESMTAQNKIDFGIALNSDCERCSRIDGAQSISKVVTVTELLNLIDRIDDGSKDVHKALFETWLTIAFWPTDEQIAHVLEQQDDDHLPLSQLIEILKAKTLKLIGNYRFPA